MEVDIEKTRTFYSSLKSEILCDCGDCRNYYLQIKSTYPEVDKYLSKMGIDIEKPYETSPLEPKDGFLEYCACQYIVFGTCEKEYHHQIGSVEFRLAKSYPSTGMKEELDLCQYRGHQKSNFLCSMNSFILNLLRCFISKCTVNPFSVIPGFYILKDS